MTIPLSNHHFMHQNMRQNGSISHFHGTRFQHLQQGRLEGSGSHDRVESVIWTPSRVATDPRWNYYCMVQCPEDNLAAKRSADEPLSGGASPKNARIAPGSPQSRSASLGDFHAAAVSDATPSGLSSLINFNTSSSEPSKSPTLTDEKKSRREIANCNERRRMQSINDGFARLKSLVPCIANEKVSKATILQQTAEHIEKESREKEQLKKIIKTFDPSYVFENDLKSSTREVSPDVSSLPTLVETKPIAPAPEPSLLNSLSALGGNNLEKTRQMLTQIQLLQAITQLQQNTAIYNPLLPEQTSAKRETDVENNENNPVLNTLLQTMLQNALAQDSTHK